MRAGKQGNYQPPHPEWGALCDDVKPLILGKLSLRDLARAATACREFRGAYVTRTAEERATLVAAGKQAYGSNMFSTFVTAVRRIMFGFVPFPDLPPLDHPFGLILISNAQEPTRTELELEEFGDDEPFGWFEEDCLDSDRLEADLFYPNGGHGPAEDHTVFWKLHMFAENNMGLLVNLPGYAAAAALGTLLAACLENPEGFPPFRQRPLTITFHVRGGWNASDALRKAEDLVAPVRSLAESVDVTVCQGYTKKSLYAYARNVQSRPLGFLFVEVEGET